MRSFLIVLITFLVLAQAHDSWEQICSKGICESETKHRYHKKHHKRDGINLGPCAPNESQTLPCPFNYQQAQDTLIEIAGRSNGVITVHTAGMSEEGRQLWYGKAGWGPYKYFSFGRLHGDECVAPKALLMVLEKLIDGSRESKRILKGATIIFLPIANPDGSIRGTRFSAPIPGWPDGRDLNRDWCPQGQNERPSPCLVNATTNAETGLPEDGVPTPPCSCPFPGTMFITRETNALMNLVLTEKPDVVMDIHQFEGFGVLEDTKCVVATQPVIPVFNDVAREDIVFRNLQISQVILDSTRENGLVSGRWNLTVRPPGAPTISSHQISEFGASNINETRFPTAGMGVEFRQVCPVYTRNLEIFAARVMYDQVKATANGKIFEINPKEAVYLPVVSRFPCEEGTICPSVLPEEDRIPEDEIWPDNDRC